MPWDDFDAFCHVVAKGTFTAAAAALERPVSSISVSIRRLEAQLGVRLLERTTRQVRVTEAGEALHQRVAPLFSQLRDAAVETQAHSHAIRGTLRVAAPYEFGAHHLGAVAVRIMSLHEQLNVEIDVQHSPANVLDQHYDIVFSMTDRELPPSNVVARRVFTLRRGLFASPDLVRDRVLPTEPDHLRDWPLLATASDTEWTFGGVREEASSVTVTRPRLRSDNANIRLQAALAGLGIARITATYCQDSVREGKLLQLLPEHACAPLRVYALMATRRLIPAKVRIFLDLLAEQSAGHP